MGSGSSAEIGISAGTGWIGVGGVAARRFDGGLIVGGDAPSSKWRKLNLKPASFIRFCSSSTNHRLMDQSRFWCSRITAETNQPPADSP